MSTITSQQTATDHIAKFASKFASHPLEKKLLKNCIASSQGVPAATSLALSVGQSREGSPFSGVSGVQRQQQKSQSASLLPGEPKLLSSHLEQSKRITFERLADASNCKSSPKSSQEKNYDEKLHHCNNNNNNNNNPTLSHRQSNEKLSSPSLLSSPTRDHHMSQSFNGIPRRPAVDADPCFLMSPPSNGEVALSTKNRIEEPSTSVPPPSLPDGLQAVPGGRSKSEEENPTPHKKSGHRNYYVEKRGSLSRGHKTTTLRMLHRAESQKQRVQSYKTSTAGQFNNNKVISIITPAPHQSQPLIQPQVLSSCNPIRSDIKDLVLKNKEDFPIDDTCRQLQTESLDESVRSDQKNREIQNETTTAAAGDKTTIVEHQYHGVAKKSSRGQVFFNHNKSNENHRNISSYEKLAVRNQFASLMGKLHHHHHQSSSNDVEPIPTDALLKAPNNSIHSAAFQQKNRMNKGLLSNDIITKPTTTTTQKQIETKTSSPFQHHMVTEQLDDTKCVRMASTGESPKSQSVDHTKNVRNDCSKLSSIIKSDVVDFDDDGDSSTGHHPSSPSGGNNNSSSVEVTPSSDISTNNQTNGLSHSLSKLFPIISPPFLKVKRKKNHKKKCKSAQKVEGSDTQPTRSDPKKNQSEGFFQTKRDINKTDLIINANLSSNDNKKADVNTVNNRLDVTSSVTIKENLSIHNGIVEKRSSSNNVEASPHLLLLDEGSQKYNPEHMHATADLVNRLFSGSKGTPTTLIPTCIIKDSNNVNNGRNGEMLLDLEIEESNKSDSFVKMNDTKKRNYGDQAVSCESTLSTQKSKVAVETTYINNNNISIEEPNFYSNDNERLLKDKNDNIIIFESSGISKQQQQQQQLCQFNKKFDDQFIEKDNLTADDVPTAASSPRSQSLINQVPSAQKGGVVLEMTRGGTINVEGLHLADASQGDNNPHTPVRPVNSSRVGADLDDKASNVVASPLRAASPQTPSTDLHVRCSTDDRAALPPAQLSRRLSDLNEQQFMNNSCPRSFTSSQSRLSSLQSATTTTLSLSQIDDNNSFIHSEPSIYLQRSNGKIPHNNKALKRQSPHFFSSTEPMVPILTTECRQNFNISSFLFATSPHLTRSQSSDIPVPYSEEQFFSSIGQMYRLGRAAAYEIANVSRLVKSNKPVLPPVEQTTTDDYSSRRRKWSQSFKSQDNNYVNDDDDAKEDDDDSSYQSIRSSELWDTERTDTDSDELEPYASNFVDVDPNVNALHHQSSHKINPARRLSEAIGSSEHFSSQHNKSKPSSSKGPSDWFHDIGIDRQSSLTGLLDGLELTAHVFASSGSFDNNEKCSDGRSTRSHERPFKRFTHCCCEQCESNHNNNNILPKSPHKKMHPHQSAFPFSSKLPVVTTIEKVELLNDNKGYFPSSKDATTTKGHHSTLPLQQQRSLLLHQTSSDHYATTVSHKVVTPHNDHYRSSSSALSSMQLAHRKKSLSSSVDLTSTSDCLHGRRLSCCSCLSPPQQKIAECQPANKHTSTNGTHHQMRRPPPPRWPPRLAYKLSSLWESLEEASCYGIEIPFVDMEDGTVGFVVFVPFLSAVHLSSIPGFLQKVNDFQSSDNFEDRHPSPPFCTQQQQQQSTPPQPPIVFQSTFSARTTGGGISRNESSSSSSNSIPPSVIKFGYFESKPPHVRRPLSVQLNRLISGLEMPITEHQRALLTLATSDDLDKEDSWMAIYWMPLQQKELTKLPPPSFLVYYSFAPTDDPCVMLSSHTSTLHISPNVSKLEDSQHQIVTKAPPSCERKIRIDPVETHASPKESNEDDVTTSSCFAHKSKQQQHSVCKSLVVSAEKGVELSKPSSLQKQASIQEEEEAEESTQRPAAMRPLSPSVNTKSQTKPTISALAAARLSGLINATPQLVRFGVLPHRADVKEWGINSSLGGNTAATAEKTFSALRRVTQSLQEWMDCKNIHHPDFEFVRKRLKL